MPTYTVDDRVRLILSFQVCDLHLILNQLFYGSSVNIAFNLFSKSSKLFTSKVQPVRIQRRVIMVQERYFKVVHVC